MATAMLPIRSDAASSASKSFFDDCEDDPFPFGDDDYEEPPPPPKAFTAMFPNASTDMLPITGTSDVPPDEADISATLDKQMVSEGTASSDANAGNEALPIAREGASVSSPVGARSPSQSGTSAPTPKRRRLRGKSHPPPEL